MVLALVARDASENSREKLVPLLLARRIPYRIEFERGQLGAAIGRGPLGAVGVTDPAIAREFERLLDADPASA